MMMAGWKRFPLMASKSAKRFFHLAAGLMHVSYHCQTVECDLWKAEWGCHTRQIGIPPELELPEASAMCAAEAGLVLPSPCFGSALPGCWLWLPKGPASLAAEPLLAPGEVLPDELPSEAADMLGDA
jgi:hypothetical protein